MSTLFVGIRLGLTVTWMTPWIILGILVELAVRGYCAGKKAAANHVQGN